jgi:hypothetical protein
MFPLSIRLQSANATGGGYHKEPFMFLSAKLLLNSFNFVDFISEAY